MLYVARGQLLIARESIGIGIRYIHFDSQCSRFDELIANRGSLSKK